MWFKMPLLCMRHWSNFTLVIFPVKNHIPHLIGSKKTPWRKIIAVVMACLLWVAFGYQKEIVRRDFVIPIEYKNVPKNWLD